MNETLLVQTLGRLEGKVDGIQKDIESIKVEMAEARGAKKVILTLAGLVGTVGGAVAGLILHRTGILP